MADPLDDSLVAIQHVLNSFCGYQEINVQDILEQYRDDQEITFTLRNTDPGDNSRNLEPALLEMTSRSVYRLEKGVKKVDEHQVREKAATVLYALLETLKIKNTAIQDSFLNKMAAEVNDVVNDFGLDRARKEKDGVSFANETISEIKRAEDVTAIVAKYDSIGDLIKKIGGGDGDEKEVTPDGLANDASTATAGGTPPDPTDKRNREIAELEDALEDMQASVKRIKGGRQTRRSSY